MVVFSDTLRKYLPGVHVKAHGTGGFPEKRHNAVCSVSLIDYSFIFL
jgi:hypothetical protein